eukprot:PhM_4_TR16522/c0_g1_i1/m.40698
MASTTNHTRMNKIKMVFSAVFLGLIFALAYTMGGGAQETVDAKLILAAKEKIELQRQRYQVCEQHKKTEALEGTQQDRNADTVKSFMTLLQKETEGDHRQLEYLKQIHTECVKDMSAERVERTGTAADNATLVIERLALENEQLAASLEHVNVSKRTSRRKMALHVMAFRLENDRLKRQIEESSAAKGQVVPTPASTVQTGNNLTTSSPV